MTRGGAVECGRSDVRSRSWAPSFKQIVTFRSNAKRHIGWMCYAANLLLLNCNVRESDLYIISLDCNPFTCNVDVPK